MWWMEFSIGMISSQQGHLIHGNNREDLKCILSMFFYEATHKQSDILTTI